MSYTMEEHDAEAGASADPFASILERAQALYDETAQRLADVRAQKADDEDAGSRSPDSAAEHASKELRPGE